MLEMNERKELVEKLNNLKWAMKDVLETYERLEYSDYEYNALSIDYPFDLSFDDMYVEVRDWCEGSIERLEAHQIIDVTYDPNGYYANMVTSDGKAYSIQSCTSDYLNYYNDVDMCEYVESIHYNELSREDKEIYLQLLNEFKERGVKYAQEY